MNDKLRMIAILVTLVVTLVLGAYVLSEAGLISASAASAASVENVFVDIDGDGHMDLLVTGKVIYNDPLAAHQPLTSP